MARVLVVVLSSELFGLVVLPGGIRYSARKHVGKELKSVPSTVPILVSLKRRDRMSHKESPRSPKSTVSDSCCYHPTEQVSCVRFHLSRLRKIQQAGKAVSLSRVLQPCRLEWEVWGRAHLLGQQPLALLRCPRGPGLVLWAGFACF